QGTAYKVNYGNESGLNEVERTRLFYVNVPVLAKYNTSVTGFSILAGPQIGKRVSASEKGSWNYTGSSTNSTIDSDSLYKEFDFSMAAGVEYAFDFGLVVGARGNFGVSNISTRRSDMYNRVAQLYLGFNFL
ncbi:MAG: PorT family protein, partial [Flavobacterium sp.]